MIRFFACFGLLLALLGSVACYVRPDDKTVGAPAVPAPAAVNAPPANGCPMFGGTPARNMVNLVDKNVLTDWSVEEKKEKNVKWMADLGSRSYSGPIVVGGKVYIGTNNANPRDKTVKDDRAVLMCFNEADGKFLWQKLYKISDDDCFKMVQKEGLLSTPHLEGNRLYFTLPDCKVVCADAADGKTLWQYDLRKELKVYPYHCTACSPLVAGDLVFVVTGNGADANAEIRKVPQPNAPSFIALDKKTGKLAWQSNLPGDQIFGGQWSNPAYAVIQGKPQVIFPGGDAALYSFEPTTGKLIWEFHCYPKRVIDPKKGSNLKYFFVATPVIHDNKVYIGLGIEPDVGPLPDMPHSYFLCIDATKTGDVSPGKSLDPKMADNKNSALVWSYGGSLKPAPKEGRAAIFDRTMSTCAVHDGLVYIAEMAGYVHCLDARTGAKQWVHDSLSGFWSSPYYVDGKVYIGTDSGNMLIFQAGKELKLLATIDMGEPMHSTAIVNNGVLFIPTVSKLYAIGRK